MKSTRSKIILSFLAACLVLTSCESDEVVPTDASLLSQELTQNASSGVVVYKDVFTIDLTEPQWFETNPCTSDRLDIVEGIWHIGITEIQNKNRLMIQFHSNTSRYRVVNQTTGVEYVGSYTNNEVGSTNYTAGQPLAYTETLSMLLTTPGKKNNIFLKVDYHITINANGTTTVEFSNYRADCQK